MCDWANLPLEFLRAKCILSASGLARDKLCLSSVSVGCGKVKTERRLSGGEGGVLVFPPILLLCLQRLRGRERIAGKMADLFLRMQEVD